MYRGKQIDNFKGLTNTNFGPTNVNEGAGVNSALSEEKIGAVAK